MSNKRLLYPNSVAFKRKVVWVGCVVVAWGYDAGLAMGILHARTIAMVGDYESYRHRHGSRGRIGGTLWLPVYKALVPQPRSQQRGQSIELTGLAPQLAYGSSIVQAACPAGMF